jgi:hypothetical protein
MITGVKRPIFSGFLQEEFFNGHSGMMISAGREGWERRFRVIENR